MARPKKNSTGDAGATGEAGASTTAGGNTHRRATKRLTLSGRVRAMESDRGKLIRLANQIIQTARGG